MPTRAAWTSIFFGALSLVTGRLLGLIELFVIGSGLLLAPLIAFGLVRRYGRPPRITRRPRPNRPTAGEQVDIDIDVVFDGRSPSIALTEHLDGVTTAFAEVPAARAGTHHRLSLATIAERRGRLTIGPSTAVFSDPLGLVARTVVLASEQLVIVHPRRSRILAPSFIATEGPLIDALRRVSGHAPTNSDFRGVRSYRAGDDVRRVNWRASARRDSLLVNEFEPQRDIELQVLIDVDATRHDAESFERAVSVAASLVDATSEPDCTISLHTTGEPIIVRDPTDALDALALIERREHPPLPNPDPRDPSVAVTRIIVTGRLDVALSHRLDALRPRHGVGVIITTGTSDVVVPRPWMSIHVDQFESLSLRWSSLIRPRGAQS